MLGKDVLERPSEWGFRTNLMFETCRRERKLKTWSTFVNLDWHVSNIKFVQKGAPTRPSPTLRMIYLRAAIPKSVIFNYARKCSGRAHSPNLSGTEGVSKNEKLPFFETGWSPVHATVLFLKTEKIWQVARKQTYLLRTEVQVVRHSVGFKTEKVKVG